MRDFMVVVKSGAHYAWDVCPAKDIEQAGHGDPANPENGSFFGIIEAGGNIWDTPDGDIPDGDFVMSYEVIAVVDVTGLPEEKYQGTYEFLKKLSDACVVNQVLAA